jgi:hypothetical protein
MIETGVVIGLGLLATISKLPWKWKVRVLSWPLVIDIIVFVSLSILHWGTFSGMVVAGVGALFCSLTLSAARKAIGYYERGEYVPGFWNVKEKLA